MLAKLMARRLWKWIIVEKLKKISCSPQYGLMVVFGGVDWVVGGDSLHRGFPAAALPFFDRV